MDALYFIAGTSGSGKTDNHQLYHKKNGPIIAGICADVYSWKIRYVKLLFVDEAQPNKFLAGYLLK
jgi:hypothetical protein